MYLHRTLHRLHHYLQQPHHLRPCPHLHPKHDPPNLKFLTIASFLAQPLLLLTTYMLQHRQRTDHDPGLHDHALVDLLHNHIIVDILLAVMFDLVLPFLDFGLPRSTTSTAELLLHTDDDHRQDAAPPWFLDVIDLTPDHVPTPLVDVPAAAKSYYDQLHAHPIRPTSPHLMLMTPGANGTTVTTPTTTITALLDPTLPPDHHHLNHPPTHHHNPQHHLEPWPSASLTVTAKTPRWQIHFRSQNLTRMTSTSVKWLRRPMIHSGYVAWPSSNPTTQYPYANPWTIPTCSSSTSSLTKCSTSWLNHIAPLTTNLFSSKQVKPPSRTLPGPLHNPDYWTSSWRSKPKRFISNQRTCWPSLSQRDCPRNRSIVASTWAPTWFTTKRVGKQLPRSLLKIAFARQLGQKTKPATRLNTHATGSSACPRRFLTSIPYRAMLSRYVHLSFTV